MIGSIIRGIHRVMVQDSTGLTQFGLCVSPDAQTHVTSEGLVVQEGNYVRVIDEKGMTIRAYYAS